MIEEKEELQGQLIASGQVVASMISQKGAKGDKGDTGSTGADGFSPIITTEKQGKVTTLTIVDAEGTKTATILDGNDGSGTGDMLKATYDQNDNGIVDNAEKVNNHTVQSDVPSDAVFTDTTYTAGTNVSISSGNVISATDTTYTAGTGIEITAGNVINNTQTSAEWGNISGTLADQTDLKNALDEKGTYSKPSGGIPKTDLASGVQTSLGLADSAIQSSDLATVATTGDYDDLIDKPTIPSKVSDLTNDSGFITGLVELSYGSSTWNDFITAYNAKKIVYCRASSGSNPGSGSQTRKAFMAYVNNVDSPTSVEFQYVRSIATHTDSQQGDQVFVYTLTNASGGTWSVSTREMSTKVVAGTNMTSSYSSGVLTLNAEAESIPVQDTAPASPSAGDLWVDTSTGEATNIIDLIYPVGSIIIKDDNTDYSNWLGFTWSKVFAGRVLVGQDTSQTEFDTIGETGGEKTHTLTTQEMPSHSHTMYDRGRLLYWDATLNNVGIKQGTGVDRPIESTWNDSTANAGGGQAHNNLQPYQVVAYWKRTA